MRALWQKAKSQFLVKVATERMGIGVGYRVPRGLGAGNWSRVGSLLGRGREVGWGWNLRSLQNYSLKTAGIGTLGSFVRFSWAQNAQNPTFKTVLSFVFGSLNISS